MTGLDGKVAIMTGRDLGSMRIIEGCGLARLSVLNAITRNVAHPPVICCLCRSHVRHRGVHPRMYCPRGVRLTTPRSVSSLKMPMDVA